MQVAHNDRGRSQLAAGYTACTLTCSNMDTGRKRSMGSEQGMQAGTQPCQYPTDELWQELKGSGNSVNTHSWHQAPCHSQLQQANTGDNDSEDLEVPSDAQATVMLLRDQLYPDPAVAAAAAAAAKQTRHAKRSKTAPGPSKAAAAAIVAAAAAATAARHLPPIVLKSQLYTVLADRTAVDRDVEDLRRQGTVRLFKLAIGADEYVVLLTSDYLRIINSMITQHMQLQQQQQQDRQQQGHPAAPAAYSSLQPSIIGSSDSSNSAQHAVVTKTLQLFRDHVVPACQESHITRTRLLQLLQSGHSAAVTKQSAAAASQQPASMPRRPSAAAAAAAVMPRKEDMERHLLALELVCRDSRAADSYMFTVPGAAAFVKSVVGGRQEMLQLLQRKKYQEVLEKELACVKLRGSCLTPTFHIKDLQGRGLVTCIDTTAGKLIRLVKRK